MRADARNDPRRIGGGERPPQVLTNGRRIALRRTYAAGFHGAGAGDAGQFRLTHLFGDPGLTGLFLRNTFLTRLFFLTGLFFGDPLFLSKPLFFREAFLFGYAFLFKALFLSKPLLFQALFFSKPFGFPTGLFLR